jgi:hypothetical protein
MKWVSQANGRDQEAASYTVKSVHNGIVGSRTIFRCRQVSVVDRFIGLLHVNSKMMPECALIRNLTIFDVESSSDGL